MEAFNGGSALADEDGAAQREEMRNPSAERPEKQQQLAEAEKREEAQARKRKEAREVYKEKAEKFRRGPSRPLSVLEATEDAIETRIMMDALPDQPKEAVPHRRLRQDQVIRTVGTNRVNPYAKELKADAVRLLNALQSADPIEALMDGLIVASSNVAMKMLERAVQTTDPKSLGASVSSATKLIKVSADLMKYRDQRAVGPQSVTVNAVKVESGGQAIVGNVQSTREPRDA